MTVHTFLAADEVSEVVVCLPTILALDERDLLARPLVALPLAEVDACGQMDVIQFQAPDGLQREVVGHDHGFGLLQQGNDQLIGHALQVVTEESVPAYRQLGLFHEPGQMLDGDIAEHREASYAGHVLTEPATGWESTGFRMEEAPSLAGLGVIAFIDWLTSSSRAWLSASSLTLQCRIAGLPSGFLSILWMRLWRTGIAVTSGRRRPP